MTVTETQYTAIAVAILPDQEASEKVSPEVNPCLEVEAPATLPEGYTFDAQFDGATFPVTVPAGGVQQGQKFVVPYPAAARESAAAPAPPRSSIPVGRWKDGLCDCCRFGCCHPACCNAFWCPLILLGQVMTRLKLTWLASEGTAAQASKTFRIMMIITVTYIVLSQAYAAVLNATASTDAYGHPSTAYVVTYYVGEALRLTYFVFLVCLVIRTRRHIRQKYRIPEGDCGGCDDCCSSFWCACCAVAQMARHTADYDTYAGQCCSETGLPPHVVALDEASPPSSSIV